MPVIPGRYAATIESDFVVFLIGTRVNRPWKLHKWLPVLLAMRPIIRELRADPARAFSAPRPACSVAEYCEPSRQPGVTRSGVGGPAAARRRGAFITRGVLRRSP
jgi:fumigallin biosynthesis monooxygenase-like protein